MQNRVSEDNHSCTFAPYSSFRRRRMRRTRAPFPAAHPVRWIPLGHCCCNGHSCRRSSSWPCPGKAELVHRPISKPLVSQVWIPLCFFWNSPLWGRCISKAAGAFVAASVALLPTQSKRENSPGPSVRLQTIGPFLFRGGLKACQCSWLLGTQHWIWGCGGQSNLPQTYDCHSNPPEKNIFKISWPLRKLAGTHPSQSSWPHPHHPAADQSAPWASPGKCCLHRKPQKHRSSTRSEMESVSVEQPPLQAHPKNTILELATL